MFAPRRFCHRPTGSTILESDLGDVTTCGDVRAALEKAVDLLITEAKIWLSLSEISATLNERIAIHHPNPFARA